MLIKLNPRDEATLDCARGRTKARSITHVVSALAAVLEGELLGEGGTEASGLLQRLGAAVDQVGARRAADVLRTRLEAAEARTRGLGQAEARQPPDESVVTAWLRTLAPGTRGTATELLGMFRAAGCDADALGPQRLGRHLKAQRGRLVDVGRTRNGRHVYTVLERTRGGPGATGGG